MMISMRQIKVVVVLLLLFMSFGAWTEEETTGVIYPISERHQRLLELLQVDGLTVIIEPASGGFIVEVPTSLEHVAPHVFRALGQYVAPKRSVEVSVHLLEGAHEAVDGKIPKKLEGVVAALEKNFVYEAYGYLDTLHLRVNEGSNAEISGVLPVQPKGFEDVFPEASIRFKLYTNAVTVVETENEFEIRFDHFSTAVEYPYIDIKYSGSSKTRSVNYREAGINTNLSVGSGQMVVVGKTNLTKGGNALFVVVEAEIVD